MRKRGFQDTLALPIVSQTGFSISSPRPLNSHFIWEMIQEVQVKSRESKSEKRRDSKGRGRRRFCSDYSSLTLPQAPLRLQVEHTPL
jgi:hypothetical protein